MTMYSKTPVTDLDHTLALEMNKVHDLKETLESRNKFIEFQKKRINRRLDMFNRQATILNETTEKLVEKERELKEYSGLHANQAKYIAELKQKLDYKTNIEETLTSSLTALLEKLDKANQEIATLRELQSASNQVNIELIREKADLELQIEFSDKNDTSNYWYRRFITACEVLGSLNKTIETWKDNG